MNPQLKALLIDIRRELSNAKTWTTIDPTGVSFIQAAEGKLNELEVLLNELPKEEPQE